MNRIKLLPVLLRNKIAAGEVIERPASVVKELLENSIDAGSRRIEITISGAGKKLICLSDNGHGMNREDALLCFERYATSKLSEEDDLFCIRSMGFRGEALSSIAAVSRVRLSTAPSGSDSGMHEGVQVEIAGGEIKEVRQHHTIGTTIEIRDLFYNTPARRKFMRTDTTENHHIIDAVTRAALAHFDIGFTLRIESDELLSLPPAASFRERIIQIYGRQVADAMLETEDKGEGLSLHAFFSRASNSRGNRNLQHLFVNRRPVRDASINHAVYKAYEDLIPRDRHAAFFIFVEIDPAMVDVNVHPAKREVRFEDKTGIYNMVFRAAREAVAGATQDFTIETPAAGSSVGEYYVGAAPVSSESEAMPFGEVFGAIMPEVLAEPVLAYEVGRPFIYLSETFVALPERDGLTMVDYHAAHERINYERLLSSTEPESHRLLFPQQVKLTPSEYRAALDNMQLLAGLGMEIDDFGHGTILVRAVPAMLDEAEAAELLAEAAAGLAETGRPAEGTEAFMNLRRAIAARLACHSSMRGRELPDSQKIAALLMDLDKCEEPDRCPHGRPARIHIAAAELKKMFRKTER